MSSSTSGTVLLVSSTLLLLSIFAFRTGVGIKCYECNSHTNSSCAAGDNATALAAFVIDCAVKPGGEKYTLCRKTEHLIEMDLYGLSPEIRVIRGCGWANSTTKSLCYNRAFYGGYQNVCACSDKDLCNTASTTQSTHIYLYIPICISILSIIYAR